MIQIFLILSILLIIPLFLFLYFYDKIIIDKTRKNYYNLNLFKKFGEIVVLILIVYFTTYYYLKDKLNEQIVNYTIIILEIIIVLFWLYLNFVHKTKEFTPTIGTNVPTMPTGTMASTVPSGTMSSTVPSGTMASTVPSGTMASTVPSGTMASTVPSGTMASTVPSGTMASTVPSGTNPIHPKTENNNTIFSKYINKNNTDFSFSNLYPDYNNKVIEDEGEAEEEKKDYSAFNGYAKDNICYGCSCVKDESGDIFCAKSIPGFGVVGCSENWECQSCKPCQTWDDEEGVEEEVEISNTAEKKQYECKNCRCHETRAGRMCGKRGRIDGEFVKCRSDCVNCSGCKDIELNAANNDNFITYYPTKKINIDNVIINNISKKDIDNLL